MNQRSFLNLYAASAILGGLAFWPAACYSISTPVRPDVDSRPIQAQASATLSRPGKETPVPTPGQERGNPAQAGFLRSSSRLHGNRGLGEASMASAEGLTLSHSFEGGAAWKDTLNRRTAYSHQAESTQRTGADGRIGSDGRSAMESPTGIKPGHHLRALETNFYEVTAYSHGCTLPRSGREPIPQRAANGRWPIADLTVAADTRIHPLGSEVLIEGLGFRLVHDRGAAIVGRRLDLFVDSCREARRFGRRWLRVYAVPRETTTYSGGSEQ